MASRRVLIELGVKVSNKGKGALKRLGSTMRSLGKIAGKGLLIGGSAAVVGLIAMTKAAANAGDAFGKMSKRTGLTVKFLTGLKHAAALSGMEFEAIEKTTKKLSKAAYDASQGLVTYQRDFDALGVSVTDANGDLKGTEELWRESTLALSKLKDGLKKTALAQNLFGKAGAKLLPMLTEGKKGLNDMMQESEDLGNVWNKKTTKDAENMNDALLRVETVIKNMGSRLVVDLIPAVTEMATSTVEWYKANKEIIDQRIGAAAEFLSKGLATAAGNAETFADNVSILYGVLKRVASVKPEKGTIMYQLAAVGEKRIEMAKKAGEWITDVTGFQQLVTGEANIQVQEAEIERMDINLREGSEWQKRMARNRAQGQREQRDQSAKERGEDYALRMAFDFQEMVNNFAEGQEEVFAKKATEHSAVLLSGA